LKQTELEKRIVYLEAMMDNPPTVIVNNYITDSLGKQQVQTQVSQPQPKTSAKTRSTGPTYTQAQVDSIKRETEKMRKEVEKQMKKEGVEPPKDPKEKKQKKGKASKDGTVSNKKSKQAQKAEKRFQQESEQYNRAVEDELRRMRRQQAVGTTALVGAVTANTIVDANNNAGTQVVRDTVIVENVKTDTVYIRDTIRVPMKDTVPNTNLQPTALVVAPASTQVPELRTARIFFASGSATIGKDYTKMLNNATAWMLKNPDKKVLLSGVTDATGSPQLNRRLAQQRIDAVKKAFEQRGVDVNRFEEEIQVSDIKTNTPSSNMRRVDMKAIH
jgi:outer membrane protein OmpA-like peptidoglycan-associated protein